MKKIIVVLAVLFTYCNHASAQTQDSTKYYFYPEQNVYFNEITQEYWYYNQPGTNWQSTKELPKTYAIDDKSTRYPVSYMGTDIWKDNPAHKTKYKGVKTDSGKMKPPAEK